MIIGIGNDLCDSRRIAATIERFGERFLRRIFTDSEITQAESLIEERRAAFFARRFAAKEACAKALGTGFASGVAHTDIAVVSDASGRPRLVLCGNALVRLNQLLPSESTANLHLSLTDELPLAAAMVVIEAEYSAHISA